MATPEADGSLRLAAAVRRLVDITVSVQGPAEPIRDAAIALEEVAARLEPLIPSPLGPRYPSQPDHGNPASFFPYDVVLGPLNPLSVPMRVEWQEPKAIGTVSFGTAYEGPPGCVHGAVIAGAFDQVLNVANLMAGTAGPTRRLELHYRKPTPLRHELRFEAWRERVDDRKVYTVGRLLAGDVVTVEAEGLFIMVPLERVMQLLGEGGEGDHEP